MKHACGNRRTAFTMMELLLALGIIIILTVIAVPAIGPMLGGRSVDGAADAVKAALMHARYSAIAQQRDGICWAIEGTTCDIGRVTSSAARGNPVLRLVDNSETAFSTSGSWTPQNHTSAELGTGSLLNAALGSGWAKWTFDLSGVSGSGPMQIWVKMRRWVNGHPTVRYKVYGTKADVNSNTPQAVIEPLSHYASTESYAWVSLGTFNVDGENAPYVTVENVGPGNPGGDTVAWDGTLGTALAPTPSPAASMVDGVQGAANFSTSGTWARSPASGNDPEATGAVNGFAYTSSTANVSATWTIQIPDGYSTAGPGPIELWTYIKEGTDRTTAARYIVRGRDSDTDATQTALLSQRDANSDGDSLDRGWFKVGNFHFDAGARTIKVQRNSSTETAVLRADAIALKGTLALPVINASNVWADAVKLEGTWTAPFVPSPGYFVTEGTWTRETSGTGKYGADYHQKARNADTAKAAWFFRVDQRQEYEVFGQWPAASTNVFDAKFKVAGAEGVLNLTINQTDTDKNGSWRSLCRTTFDPGTLGYVEIDSSGPSEAKTAIADAVAVVPVTTIFLEPKPVIGYHFFGYRPDDRDGYPSTGIVPGETILTPASVQELSHPGSVPILADLLAPNSSEWTTHKDGVHILYMDGRVDWVPAEKTKERWVDTYGNRFRW